MSHQSKFAPRALRLFFMLALIPLLTTPPPAQTATPVFINEIHYDNVSTDTGEAIEVAGPAGTDLTGWQLILYNGANGLMYGTDALSGLIPDHCGGFGTVVINYPSNGLQNGSPDGMALVDNTNTVVQFLSYEGAFTAVDGPAATLTSTDIGVAEGSSTPVGSSLQLGGTGTMYEDFAWEPEAPHTFAACNTNQVFGTDFTNLVINEVDADQPSTDNAEFVELYDGGTGNTDLTGLVLVLYNGSGDTSYNAFDLDGYSTNANGYFVLCGDATTVANCDVDVTPDTNLIQNGADAVALYEADAAAFPNGTAVTATNLLDALVYDTNDADDPELLATLTPGQPQINEGELGDATGHANQRCPNGAGGQRVTTTYTQALPSPGAANTCATPPPPVVINEVDADQPSTDNAEFVEIYDGGIGHTDLTGLVLVLYNGNGDTSYNAFDLDGQSTNANGYFVLCGDATTVANCDVDVTPDTNLIQNGADAVAVYAANASDFPNGTAVTATNLLDALVYDTDDADDPELLATLTPGQPQINEGELGDATGHANQRCPDGAGGPLVTTTYTQLPPSPGTANNCPLPQILINEVDADTPGTDVLEFVELYDGGVGHTDLTDLVLVFFNGNGDTTYDAFDLDGFTTDAAGYFLLGNSGVTPTPDIIFASNGLQNGADAVALYTGDAADFPAGTAVTTTNLLDALVYDTADADDPGLLVLLNPGEPQVDEDGAGDKDNHANQRCPNGSGGQRNTSTFIPFFPTPKSANLCVIPTTADLELALTIDNANPNELDTVNLTIEIRNNPFSVDNAAGIQVQVNLPASLTYTGDDSGSTGTTYNSVTGLWDVTPLTLTVGDTIPLTIQATVNSGTNNTITTATAQVTAAAAFDPDSTPGNLGAAPAEDDEGWTKVQVGTPAVCGTAATLISTIQGSGATSPQTGSSHTIEAVVVGDYQSTITGLSGFHVQEEDADADGSSATSEGVFIYDNGFGLDVKLGDVVRVTGTVSEFETSSGSGAFLTEIGGVTDLLICGSSSVTPATVTLPITSLADWERYEGMLVHIPHNLVVTEHFNLGRFGEAHLALDRLLNPTAVVAPGAPAIAQQDLNDRSRIVLDDGSSLQNSDPTLYPAPGLSAANTLRTGATLSGITAVLEQRFSVYRLQPVGPLTFNDDNPRATAPDSVNGRLQVASFNVLNYFNGDGMGGGFPTPRGATTLFELNRQRDKIITAILAMDADIIGLMELENDGYGSLSAIQELVNGLNAVAGAGTYAFIDPGVPAIGTDEITVAILYQPATVTPVGAAAILDSSVDPLFDDTKNRPTLAQTFAENATDERLTVAVNHLKSKGSACDDVGDPDTGDGQGNCNQTRTNAATALVNWLATDPTGSGDPDFLIIGDMNAYTLEDPITTVEGYGYTNLIKFFAGLNAYSYVFNGQFGYLDHALSSPDLTGQVTGVTAWPINADEPRVLDYNTEFKTANHVNTLYAPDAYRASDHDPIIVGLDLFSPPPCNGRPATIYVDDNNMIVGGSDDGQPYRGVLHGTDADDVILGTDGPDLINGRFGSDTICGQSSGDILLGILGDDILLGGDGPDLLIGGPGNDTLFGEGGDDLLIGNHGLDSLDGGDGDDILHSGQGADSLSGGSGHDILDGDGDDDALNGGSESDICNGGAGTDTSTACEIEIRIP